MIIDKIFRQSLAGLRRIGRNRKGIAATEFAFVAPVFLGLMLMSFEAGFAVYARSVLQGAVEQAARRASLENWRWDDIQEDVETQVKTVIPASEADTQISFRLDPTYYASYTDIELPEDFTDTNGNGEWDANECFVDRNNNASYDIDVGLAGRGGAQDVVSIDAELEYVRPFPLWGLFNASQTQTIRVTTYLRNQPFSAQAARVGVRICPAV
jgi:Flp pilus assembly protein TadG